MKFIKNRSTLSKTSSLPLIDFSKSFWHFYKKKLKRFSIIPSTSLPIIISMLSLSECIVCITSESLDEKKKTAIANWIFHLPWVLRSLILLKYGLISLRRSSIDSVLALSPLLLYSM